MNTEAMKLPPMPEPEGFADPSCGGFMAYTADQMRDFALQARAQVQGEAFGYIHHFAAHDERGVLINTTWEADGCADPLPHPTFPSMWKWTHCTPFYTTPQPAQATQAEVTDAQINAVALEQWGPHTGGPLAAHRAFARAILALRPQAVPMTDTELCEALGIDWSDGWTFDVRDAVEKHHGIKPKGQA